MHVFKNSYVFVLAAFAFVLMTGRPVSAYAEDFNAAGAQNIKQQLQNWLDFQIETVNGHNTPGATATGEAILTEGDITVVPQDSYYAAQLPEIIYQMQNGARFDLGSIKMNIVPDTATKWQTTMALPRTLTVTDPTGEQTGRVVLGDQRFKGLWHADNYMFSQIDATYKDIEFIPETDNFAKGHIDAITLNQDLVSDSVGPAYFSGPIEMVLNGIDITRPGGNGKRILIDRLTSDTTYTALPLLDLKNYAAKAGVVYGNDDSEQTNKFALAHMVFAMLPQSYQADVTAENITIKTPGSDDITTDRVVISSTGDKLNTDNGTVTMRYTADDIQSGETETALSPYIPTQGTININADNIPAESLSKILDKAFLTIFNQAENLNIGERHTIFENALKEMPFIFRQNGVSISIVNSRLKAPKLDITMEGEFTPAAANAKTPFKGILVMRVDGLANAMADIQRQIQLNRGDLQQNQMAFQFLTVFQAMGKPDGTARVYEIEFVPTGEILLNGVNFSSMLQGGLPSYLKVE